ncbi:MAG: hypothetical protein IJF05_02995 [Clostridia bacterium]|nr:hypothetical protein [Clostridia bacterium]
MLQRYINVDFSKSAGRIKPLLALNSGPLATASLSVDLSQILTAAGVAFIRTHGHPAERVVDIHTVFPDFNLDERFEQSYNFAPTDKYLRAIKDMGAGIMLRLGESPEPYEIKRHAALPASPEKWAAVCERIIAHYNEGWGGGMKLGIKQVEIVLGCDFVPDEGERVKLYELYRTVANRLRSRFPRIKIGGYSSGGFHSLNHYDATDEERGYVEFLEGFLSYVTNRETEAPLDFFTWSCHAETPEELSLHSNYARNFLNQNGLKRTQSVISDFSIAPSAALYTDRAYPALLISSLILAQKGDTAMLFLDGNPESDGCPLFSLEDRHSVHTYAAYKALCAFGVLSRLGTAVPCTEDYRHAIYSLAATDGTEGAVIVATDAYNGGIEISVEGREFSTYSISGIIGGGKRGDGFTTSARDVPLTDGRVRLRAGKNELYLITLK